MDPYAGSPIQDGSVELLLGDVIQGDRARALRAQLASSHPRQSAEQIEEAVQAACEDFITQGETISEPGALYAWVRTVAYRKLAREDAHGRHELPVDPTEGTFERAASEEPGPEEELIALEDDLDLELLVREVADSLSGRRREILALWGGGLKRPEIASRLGLSERAVKRDLLAVMEEARVVLAGHAGSGCELGEPLVLRAAYGLAAAEEAEQARLHLSRCHRCAEFSERLDAWRQKAGALLPAPAAPAAVEQASPGLLARIGHRVADGISSVKQQILGGGAGLRQQAATGTYGRTLDPTPLVGIRPGPVVAVVVGCIAVAGGGATYCAQNGVDPLGAVGNLIAGTEESEPPPAPEATEATEPAPVVPPPTPVTEEAVSQPSGSTQPETTYAPEPKPEPEPAPEPEPEPEASFEPSAPVTATAGEEVVAEPATESAPAVKAKPTAAPSGDAPQFGGP
ncbi:MAG: sigma-70 family RNA polymerase sigma factor [Actinobacteria bacterium]|nr:sigma-70 family RNA polymerase sigma factor [Actinomycetota bacterium]